MRSIASRHGKCKRLGEATDWSAMDFDTQPMDTKGELIRALIPLGLRAVQEMLEAEVWALAGARYSRGGERYRHGANPGSVKLQGQRHRVRVPRVRDRRGQEVALESWAALRDTREPDEVLLRRVLYGLSCRNYAAAAEALPGAIGLSSASVSRAFVEASREQLKAFRERDLSKLDLVAVFLDGKSFADDTMVIALGITMDGEEGTAGFCPDRHRERPRVDSVFARSPRSRFGCFPGIARDPGWVQGLTLGGASGIWQIRRGATLSVAQAGECGSVLVQGPATDLAPSPTTGV